MGGSLMWMHALPGNAQRLGEHAGGGAYGLVPGLA
jgi:hypothetical protein